MKILTFLLIMYIYRNRKKIFNLKPNINQVVKVTALAIALAVFIFLLRVNIFAQEIEGTTKKTALGVNPAIVEIILVEKTPTEKEIILYNLTNYALPIKTMRQSFTPREKLEIPEKDLKRFDASSWIYIDPDNTDFILQPKEVRKINIKVTQPDNAAPGGHYAEIVFQPLIPQSLVSTESVYIFARVAVLGFFQVKGDIVENLKFENSLIKKFYQTKPDSFDLNLKNSGNVHLLPSGQLLIYDEINKKNVGKITLNPSIILPGTTKTYLAQADNLELKMGKYSISGEIIYGVNNQLIKIPRITFYIFPYLKISILFAILFVLMLVIYIVRKRLFKALKILLFNR